MKFVFGFFPPKVTLIFMQKMELLLSKCPPTVIANHVLPMIYRALESDAQQIQVSFSF